VRLSNPPGFDDKPFSSIQAARVSVKLLPLLARKVEVSRVDLQGLELHLVKREDGRNSWADFVSGPEQDQGAAAANGTDANGTGASPAEPASAQSWGLENLSLDGVRLRDATITWEDKLLGTHYAFSDMDVDVKAIRPGQPCDFEASCLLQSAKPQYDAQVKFTGTAVLNAGEGRHIFSNLSLKVAAKGKDVPGGKGDFAFGLQELKVDSQRQTAAGTGLTVAAYGAKGTGQFQAANINNDPDVKGRLDFADFNGRELSAALTGKTAEKLVTADVTAYQHITASIEFKHGRGYTEIPTFTASLDDARVEGRFRSVGLEKKAYSFNVQITGLDADRFLPAKKTEAEQEAARKAEEAAAGHGGASPAAHKDDLFPVDKLRAMKLDGQITAERLKYKGLRFAYLKLPMMAQDGVLDVGPVEARLYDGSLHGSLRVDVQGDRPVTTLSAKLSGVQQKPLFSDISGKESQYSGLMSAETLSPLVGQGNTMFALKRGLVGRVRFSVRDGVFPGVNMLHVVQSSSKARAVLGDAPSSAETATRFGSIDGTAAIMNGVASINDLDLKAPSCAPMAAAPWTWPPSRPTIPCACAWCPAARGRAAAPACSALWCRCA